MSYANVLEKERQAIYKISFWQGGKFIDTFTPSLVNNIYLLANQNIVLNFLEANIHFWPITNEYVVDDTDDKKIFSGEMVITQDDIEIGVLNKRFYSYYYPKGVDGEIVKLLCDEEANDYYKKYILMKEVFQESQMNYEIAKNNWFKIIDNLLKENKDIIKKDIELPEPPNEPTPPGFYVSKPEESYIINLKPGNYQIEFIDNNGKKIPGSKKNLIVFKEKQVGIGYEIISENKWTKPIRAVSPPETIYISGDQTLYLDFFQTQEYNSYYYEKMAEANKALTGLGLKKSYHWINAGNIEVVKVFLENNNKIQQVYKKTYFVKQTPDNNLGYEIIEAIDKKTIKYRSNLQAFKIKTEDFFSDYKVRVRLKENENKIIPGSIVYIRKIKQISGWFLYLVPFFVFTIMVGVFLWRFKIKRYK